MFVGEFLMHFIYTKCDLVFASMVLVMQQTEEPVCIMKTHKHANMPFAFIFNGRHAFINLSHIYLGDYQTTYLE